MIRLLALVFLAIIASANAQDFYINKVDVFDGETLIKDTGVLVIGGKIVKVSRSVPDFKGEIIDGEGGFLMPGMINAHVHAFMPAPLKEAAQAGVLNLLDMHGVERYQKMMASVNESSLNARYFYAGYAATAPEGHGTQFGFPVPTLTKAEDAEAFVKARKEAGVSYIKIIVEPRAATLNHDIVAAIVKSAQKQDLKAVVHASRLADADSVLSANANGLVHIWRDKPMAEQRLKTLTENKDFFVIPTLITTKFAYDKLSQNSDLELMSFENILKEVKRLYDAGVPILAGTDPPNFDINFGIDLYKELEFFAQAGLPPLAVLKSATANTATQFGLEGVGFIKPGYHADLILLKASPLTDINNIKSDKKVWKSGRLVPQEN